MADTRHAHQPAAVHLPARAAAPRVPVYGRGRVCAEPDCRTVLSSYNPSAYCWLHEGRRASTKGGQRKERVELDRICAFSGCERPFVSSNPVRIYCSDRCRMASFQKRHALHQQTQESDPAWESA